MVGAWQLVEVLGRGGTSRVFKVRRNGRFYTMKMALGPITLTEDEQVREEGVYRRLGREVSALFTYASHPHLLRVYAVDFWPDPTRGYPYLVTKFVDGETWHEWRWRTHPDAFTLVSTFTDVVRTVGVLHAHGTYHRDLKAENILIRRTDNRAFLIDLGSARLSSALTKTLGLPEGALHLVPPELLAYVRKEGWKQGEPFHWGAAADLYSLGALLYESLTDHHPFDPHLSDEALLAAIASVPPVPPHELNPRVPRSLSDLTLKLLEKRPEDRYASTEALLQALEQTSPEHSSPAWKVPLLEGSEMPAEWRPRPSLEESAPVEARRERPPTPRRTRWRVGLLAGLLLLGFVLWRVRSTLPSPEKGSPSVPTSSLPDDSTPSTPRVGLLTAWLCAAAGLGCPGAQVRPLPEPGRCPPGSSKAMYEDLRLHKREGEIRAVLDVRQPLDEHNKYGVYKTGPLIGRTTTPAAGMPQGTLLYGYIWTAGITNNHGEDAFIGRYTQAVLPDGRKYPVCFIVGEMSGRMYKSPGSTPDTAIIPREELLIYVDRWP
jgi:serine/threonine-protein kinase